MITRSSASKSVIGLRANGPALGYRRFVNMYVNGYRKTPTVGNANGMMEDAQTPGADMLQEFFNTDQNGSLYKLNHGLKPMTVPARHWLP